MFKIKKKVEKPKLPILYNIIEDYSDFDAPGNVTACAMTLREDLAAHAKVLSESYEVPLETMTKLLTEGGVYVYPKVGGVLTRGLFACRIDPTGETPKQTWTLDLMQFAEANNWLRHGGSRLKKLRRLSFTGRCRKSYGPSSSRRILGSITARWTAPSPRAAISSTSIFGRIGPRISSASASCRMVDLLRREDWGSLHSSMALRRLKPGRWSSREVRLR